MIIKFYFFIKFVKIKIKDRTIQNNLYWKYLSLEKPEEVN